VRGPQYLFQGAVCGYKQSVHCYLVVAFLQESGNVYQAWALYLVLDQVGVRGLCLLVDRLTVVCGVSLVLVDLDRVGVRGAERTFEPYLHIGNLNLATV